MVDVIEVRKEDRGNGLGDEAPVGKDPKNPKRDSKVKRMGTGSIPKLIVEFAIPSIVGMLVNGAYNVIDSAFLGQAMGEIGIAAMTVANPTMIVFFALAMLVGAGGNALAALRMGEGKREEAERSLGNTVFLCIVISVVVIVCALIPFILDSLLSLSSATPEVRPYAASFLRILAFGYIFQCIGMAANNFIRTSGAPNRALITMIVGTLFCVFFNYLFVLQFGWGVEGSAWATVLGQVISCGAVLWYFLFTKNVPIKLRARFLRPVAATVRSILALGMASFCVQAAAAVVNFVLNHLLVLYGGMHPLGADNALASIGVVQRIGMFTVLPLIGLAIAIQPLIGFNYGARLIPRVRKTLWYAIAGSVILGTLTWLLVHIFPEQIIGAFGMQNEELAQFSIFALKIQLLMLPIVGFQIIGGNYFQATGQPLKSVILTLTRQMIYLVPLLLILPHVLPALFPQFNSLDALYFAMPIADFMSIFTCGLFLFFEMKRLRKLESGKLKPRYIGE